MSGGTNVTRQQYDSLMNYFGQDMIWEPIHDANVFREASSANCSIFEMPGSNMITKRAQEEYLKGGQEDFEITLKDALCQARNHL